MNWKMLRLLVTGIALVAGIGCGGINGTHTITPASFFLPGLGHAPSTNAPSHTFAAIQ